MGLITYFKKRYLVVLVDEAKEKAANQTLVDPVT
jgi:hypothetical protein